MKTPHLAAMDKRSSCCAAEPRPLGRFGVCPEDLGICVECGEHCTYEDDDNPPTTL